MKKLILTALFCSIPFLALSHPGKTDRHGGHKCVKGCEEWKLYYTEYHLHDKSGRPIRVAKKPKRTVSSPMTAQTITDLPLATETPRTMQTVTVYQYIAQIKESAPAFNPFLWILLILLLLLLILRMNRKRE